MEEKVKRELLLYRLREIEIEDMKLKIEELKVGEQIGSSGFEERVQTSMNCTNNDKIMNQIETLENKIKFNEIANKRVDNALKVLSDAEIQVVKMLLVEKNSISETTKKLYRSKRQVYYILDQAINKIKIA
jgi:DNA-directed RNA polymerase specialized sigma subunit